MITSAKKYSSDLSHNISINHQNFYHFYFSKVAHKISTAQYPLLVIFTKYLFLVMPKHPINHPKKRFSKNI